MIDPVTPSSVNLIIRDFPAADHERLKAQAARERSTLQQLTRTLLCQAARMAPQEAPSGAGNTVPMLVTEAEMRWHLVTLSRAVAIRVGIMAEHRAELLSADEIRSAIEAQDTNTYLALSQHLNAYADWWRYNRWISETGRSGHLTEAEATELHRHIGMRESTRRILISRVESVASERRAARQRSSTLRSEFDKTLADAIEEVADHIRGSGDILQAPGRDGWMITAGRMPQGSEMGYGCTFDPPANYENVWFREPRTAAKVFVDAVGPELALGLLQRPPNQR